MLGIESAGHSLPAFDVDKASLDRRASYIIT